jgi:C-terminal processing protease CtpA/Prc
MTILDDIGYVRVNGFSGSESEATEFAASLQALIAEQDHENIRGWLVDLRDNSGGNMWPMIAGIGPLLWEGTYGYFIDPDSNISSWGYLAGSSVLEDSNIVSVEQPYELLNASPRIAVLSSRRVASSGEATLIAFKKLDNVKIFGTDSCGLSTANSMFELSDGAEFFLTVSTMADREMIKYGDSIEVDVDANAEDAVDVAVEWIMQ